MTQWEKLLKSLGFTDSEAKIYLLSLESGASPVQDLAKKAHVSRVTTYAVIESLMKNGLMSTVQKGKKNYYVAESPERLLSFVHGRVKTMEATLREIETSLPDLKLLQRGEKPIVKMLEGIEGIKAMLEDILSNDAKHVDEFGNVNAITAVFSAEELKAVRGELSKRKTQGRFLYIGDIKHSPREGVEARRLPSHHFTFNGDIIVYKNKVALSTLRGKLITVILENHDIAETVRALFELAWNNPMAQKE